jgi:glycine cleavage system H lipoate-binding protein
MKSDIPPSQVISDDKYDIGWLLVLSPKELESKKEQTSGIELH